MTNPSALRALVSIWRKQQAEYPLEGALAAAAVQVCADELESALSQQPMGSAAVVTDEMVERACIAHALKGVSGVQWRDYTNETHKRALRLQMRNALQASLASSAPDGEPTATASDEVRG
jgi:hypothetical protein